MSEDNNGKVFCPECNYEIEEFNREIVGGDFFYNYCLICNKYIKIEDTIQMNEEEEERRRREVVENHRERMRTRVDHSILINENVEEYERVVDNFLFQKQNSRKRYSDYEIENVWKPSFEKHSKIKEYLKQVNWHEISDNWEIQVYTGAKYKTITLNPYQGCSESNPLYMHKKWLEWVYNNKELNLNDLSIAEICGLNNKTIGNWRKKFNISTKVISYYFKKGYKFLNMAKEYKHPELNPIGVKRIYRAEHIIVMENHLNKTLTQEELSLHPCLIENDSKYYIKEDCVVHHKNHIRLGNRIENLWLYKNKSEHSNSNINICFSALIKLGQILFSKGNYFINHDYDYRCLNPDEIDKIKRQKEFVDYKDLDLVKQTIKNMDWSDMEWNIEYRIRNYAPIEKIRLNPYEDCSEENPLYRHKGWVERIVHDKRFYLTDLRLGTLCGISSSATRRWRERVHKIFPQFWGFDRYLGRNSSGKWIIFKKVSKSYGNPFAVEKVNSAIMRESRYIMESYLAQEPELNKRYLINGKYLKQEYLVHHINLDKLDNRLENFYLCENHSEHNKVHNSLIKLVDELLRLGLMIFDNGKYFLASPYSVN